MAESVYNSKSNAAPACIPGKDTTLAQMKQMKCYVAGFGPGL